MVGTVDVVVVVGHGQRGTAHRPGAAVKEATTRCRNTTTTSSPAGSFTHVRVYFIRHMFHECFHAEAAKRSCVLVHSSARLCIRLAATLQEEAVKSTGLRSFEFLEKDRNPSGHVADTSNEEAVSVGPGLELTDGSVFSHEAAVCDDRVRVEVQQHWAEGEDGAWDGAPTQGSKCSVTRGQAVDLHPIIDTAGMC